MFFSSAICRRIGSHFLSLSYKKTRLFSGIFRFLSSTSLALSSWLCFYLFVHWKRLRAPFWPYFLRSFIRESRVRKLPFLRSVLNAGSTSKRARAIPSLKAPACPDSPPPLIFAKQSNLFTVFVVWNGCFIRMRSVSRIKYLSRERLFTVTLPFPGTSLTRAIASLRLPFAV